MPDKNSTTVGGYLGLRLKQAGLRDYFAIPGDYNLILLDANTTLIAETGDSWFNGIHMRLPQSRKFEIQMQYGSIGWSVGATLGYHQ